MSRGTSSTSRRRAAGFAIALAVSMPILTSVGVSPAPAVGTPPRWTQQAPASSPSARYRASTAFDPATGQLVLFGGSNGTPLADTWVWNGTDWSQRFPATSPPNRAGASMAFDGTTGQLVLFGGWAPSGPWSDTW